MIGLKIFFYRLLLRISSFLGKKRKAVFLDRDGTINYDSGYVGSIADFKLFPETIPALKKLSENGFLLIIVTNQSGVGRGYFKMADVRKIHRHLEKILAKEKIYLAKIYVCPHRPDENCRCRKPRPYFFEKAVSEFNLIRKKCYSIGDKKRDIEAGKKAGIKGILLGRDFKNLVDAVEFIVNESE
ncbi:MAG: HAD family hydrolase [Elusimicrobia bacterium]|nr:HAD family hydrolase [Elusimicrobiota bacterium]